MNTLSTAPASATGNYDNYFAVALRQLEQQRLYPCFHTCENLQEIANQQPLPDNIKAELGRLATSDQLTNKVSKEHQFVVGRVKRLADELHRKLMVSHRADALSSTQIPRKRLLDAPASDAPARVAPVACSASWNYASF
ncbi:MAG: hypothetical protein R3C49_13665 [Planctomycetaceae bacterium]